MERERLITMKDTSIEALQLVPSLELLEVSGPEGIGYVLPGKRADIEFCIRTRKSKWLILVEWKNNGEPRYVRAAVQQLAAYMSDQKQRIGIIAAPYLGPVSRQICSEPGLGFVDLAGNMRIVFIFSRTRSPVHDRVKLDIPMLPDSEGDL